LNQRRQAKPSTAATVESTIRRSIMIVSGGAIQDCSL
jgi:hypothetical protein